MQSFLYLLVRLLGDVNAVRKARVDRSIARRAAGKVAGPGLRKLFR
jgi:hypothetical protein